MVCHQSFESEDCDTKSNVEGDLNIHEETTHGEIDSNDCLSWTQRIITISMVLMKIATRKLTPLRKLLQSLIISMSSV